MRVGGVLQSLAVDFLQDILSIVLFKDIRHGACLVCQPAAVDADVVFRKDLRLLRFAQPEVTVAVGHPYPGGVIEVDADRCHIVLAGDLQHLAVLQSVPVRIVEAHTVGHDGDVLLDDQHRDIHRLVCLLVKLHIALLCRSVLGHDIGDDDLSVAQPVLFIVGIAAQLIESAVGCKAYVYRAVRLAYQLDPCVCLVFLLIVILGDDREYRRPP